ncbi:MAG TPA: hypothetical protein VKR58_15110 [Aquella sp.]|nr:hypothetical protein [Aquella sp.]
MSNNYSGYYRLVMNIIIQALRDAGEIGYYEGDVEDCKMKAISYLTDKKSSLYEWIDLLGIDKFRFERGIKRIIYKKYHKILSNASSSCKESNFNCYITDILRKININYYCRDAMYSAGNLYYSNHRIYQDEY